MFLSGIGICIIYITTLTRDVFVIISNKNAYLYTTKTQLYILPERRRVYFGC
jgi:hypothetical protein